MRFLLAMVILVTGCSPEESSLETCVAGGKPVSINTTVRLNCAEPNTGASLRERTAEERAANESQVAKEEKARAEAMDRLQDLEILGSELLTKDGRVVLSLDSKSQLATLQELLAQKKELFTPQGQKLLVEYHAAREHYANALPENLRFIPFNPFQDNDPLLKAQGVLGIEPIERLNEAQRAQIEESWKVFVAVANRIVAARIKQHAEEMRPKADKGPPTPTTGSRATC